MRLTSMLFLGLLIVACDADHEKEKGSTPAVLTSAALDSLRAVDAAFAAGMNAKDTTAVFAVYAPDAKVMPPDSPVLEGAAAHPELAGMIAAGASDFVLNSTTAYGVGDLAYMVGTASFKMGGSAQSVKYAEVLRRGADGRWRYVVDMFSGVAPPPAPAKK